MNEGYVRILGIRIDKVTNQGAYNKFLSLFEEKGTQSIFTPNTEIIMKAQEDEELREVLENAGMVIPDGIGLIYASKIYGLGLTERVAGIDMMDRILDYCNKTKKSIFILGGKAGVAEEAMINIQGQYDNILCAGTIDGYYSNEDEYKVVDKINESKCDVLFVALGAPKQEKWIAKYQNVLNASVAIGVGGSVDVWSGNSKRAPKIFIKLGLEWFYRLITDPRRIFRMMSIPKFIFKVLITRNKG